MSRKAEDNAAYQKRFRHRSEEAAVRAFLRVVPRQKAAAPLRNPNDPLYQTDVGPVRVAGNDQIARFRSAFSIGPRIDQKLVARAEGGNHAVARDPKAAPPPREPQQQVNETRNYPAVYHATSRFFVFQKIL